MCLMLEYFLVIFSKFIMGIVLLLFVFVSFGIPFIKSGYTTKTCSKKESNLVDGHLRYFVKYFCCGNHETIGNNCKECEVGFTSINGDKCKKCKSGAYGKRCVELCQCNKDQRCDHVLGCVHILHESNNEKRLRTTDNMIKDSETTVDLFGKHSGSQAPFHINIIIYCVCVLCTIIVMTLCNFCIRQLRQKEAFHVHKSRRMQSMERNTIQSNGRRLPHSEQNDYDEIDETTSMDGILYRSGTVNNDDSSSYDEDMISSDGYLNPYQPVVAYTNAHKYTTCIHISNKMKATNSLPALLGCLTDKHVDCNCFEPIEDRTGISLISHVDQRHRTIPPKKIDRFCSLKQKGRWSM